MLLGLPGSGVVLATLCVCIGVSVADGLCWHNSPTPAWLTWKSLGVTEAQMCPQLSSASALQVYLFLICLKRVDNSLCSDYVWEYTPSYVPKQATVVGTTHKDVVPREEFYPIKTQV